MIVNGRDRILTYKPFLHQNPSVSLGGRGEGLARIQFDRCISVSCHIECVVTCLLDRFINVELYICKHSTGWPWLRECPVMVCVMVCPMTCFVSLVS